MAAALNRISMSKFSLLSVFLYKQDAHNDLIQAPMMRHMLSMFLFLNQNFSISSIRNLYAAFFISLMTVLLLIVAGESDQVDDCSALDNIVIIANQMSLVWNITHRWASQ